MADDNIGREPLTCAQRMIIRAVREACREPRVMAVGVPRVNAAGLDVAIVHDPNLTGGDALAALGAAVRRRELTDATERRIIGRADREHGRYPSRVGVRVTHGVTD